MKQPILGWLLLLVFFCSTRAPAQEKTLLARAMGQIHSSSEELKQNIRNDSLDQDNILSIYHLTQAALMAATLDPPGVDRIDESRRQRYIDAYRAALSAMVADAEILSDMVKKQEPADDRYDQLMKVLSHQKRGHQNFQRR